MDNQEAQNCKRGQDKWACGRDVSHALPDARTPRASAVQRQAKSLRSADSLIRAPSKVARQL